MSSFYFESVTNEPKYSKCAKDAEPLSKLPVTSSSRWGAEHLIACHVIVDSKDNNSLPVLDNYLPTIGETFKAIEENTQMAAFINGLAPDHQIMRQHALVRQPEVGATLARVWAALRDIKTLNGDQGEPQTKRQTSERVRSKTTNPGYIDSEVIASLGQDYQDSQSSFSTTVTDSFTSLQMPATYLPIEAYTAELAFAAISHIILYTQEPGLDMPVEVRHPERGFIEIGSKRITAIDDGGLTLISSSGKRTKKSVVLIEAKRRLDVCDMTNRPFVSNERLGQMTCEAIVARSSRQGDDDRDDTFIISSAQHYMCFFHFIITMDHLKDLEDGEIPAEAIKVSATRWFNLERSADRKFVVKNVTQLAEYMRGLGARRITSADL